MDRGYRPRDYTVEEQFAVLDENAIDVEFTVVLDDDGRTDDGPPPSGPLADPTDCSIAVIFKT